MGVPPFENHRLKRARKVEPKSLVASLVVRHIEIAIHVFCVHRTAPVLDLGPTWRYPPIYISLANAGAELNSQTQTDRKQLLLIIYHYLVDVLFGIMWYFHHNNNNYNNNLHLFCAFQGTQGCLTRGGMGGGGQKGGEVVVY